MLFCHLQLGDIGSILKIITPNETILKNIYIEQLLQSFHQKNTSSC